MPYAPRSKVQELAEQGLGFEDILVKLELPKRGKWPRYVKAIVFKKVIRQKRKAA